MSVFAWIRLLFVWFFATGFAVFCLRNLPSDAIGSLAPLALLAGFVWGNAHRVAERPLTFRAALTSAVVMAATDALIAPPLMILTGMLTAKQTIPYVLTRIPYDLALFAVAFFTPLPEPWLGRWKAKHEAVKANARSG